MVDRSVGPAGEWVEHDGSCATIGYTQQALLPLGEIVWVGLPKIGAQLNKGDVAVVLESAKAATDCEAPVSGTVIEINHEVQNCPELLQKDPEQTWVYRVQV